MTFAAFISSDEDPFTAFGSDDDDDDDSDLKSKVIHRSAENGVLTFHEGTEQALLLYVQQRLDQETSCTGSDDSEQQRLGRQRRQRLLGLVDDFCMTRHWMMHVGVEKGMHLLSFLQERLIQHDMSKPFVLVEIGTYCGYSACKLADAIIQQYPELDFTIFTVDVSPHAHAVARRMVELAGVSDRVSFILLPDATTIRTTTLLSDRLHVAIRERLGTKIKSVDFLFIDHAKELYLSDVQQLEETGLIQVGTAVAADNVVFFGLEKYRNHMQELQKQGIVETKLVTDNIWLEYVSSEDCTVNALTDANDPKHADTYKPKTRELRDGMGM